MTGEMWMTIGKLVEHLKAYPDDLPVLVCHSGPEGDCTWLKNVGPASVEKSDLQETNCVIPYAEGDTYHDAIDLTGVVALNFH